MLLKLLFYNPTIGVKSFSLQSNHQITAQRCERKHLVSFIVDFVIFLTLVKDGWQQKQRHKKEEFGFTF